MVMDQLILFHEPNGQLEFYQPNTLLSLQRDRLYYLLPT